MDTEDIRKKINSLDPVIDRALIEALTKKIAHMEGKTVGVKAGNGVSSDVFLDIFNKAVAVLNKKYIEGGTSYIEKYRPYLEKETQEAEEKLNRTDLTPVIGPVYNLESKPFENQYQTPWPQELVAYSLESYGV